ncbi:hypothetical protein M0813_28907 [Anaeramoeba flamelloides]|uniref:Uncharacterized protein n=1 Tax=Anaeramoeba flamelloides TaxID=1746091 RepID=A0ABQ8XRG7_9EUKA|nr:hypothetical protein M0813_28907 [Anaeramoeba flamelloides]
MTNEITLSENQIENLEMLLTQIRNVKTIGKNLLGTNFFELSKPFSEISLNVTNIDNSHQSVNENLTDLQKSVKRDGIVMKKTLRPWWQNLSGLLKEPSNQLGVSLDQIETVSKQSKDILEQVFNFKTKIEQIFNDLLKETEQINKKLALQKLKSQQLENNWNQYREKVQQLIQLQKETDRNQQIINSRHVEIQEKVYNSIFDQLIEQDEY